MHYCKITPEGLKEIKKQRLTRAVPVLVIAATVGIAISTINSKDQTTDVNVLPIIIPIMAIAVGFGLFRGLKRITGQLESYQLGLSDNLITREQLNTPAVSIYFNEIKEISKKKNGNFIIKGKDPTDLIEIPAQIENYAEIEAKLNQITPVSSIFRQSFFQKNRILFTLLTVALIFFVFTSSNKIIVAFSGTTLISVLLFSFFEARRSKNIDDKTKRGMLWIFVVLASIIGVMIAKLMGIQ